MLRGSAVEKEKFLTLPVIEPRSCGRAVTSHTFFPLGIHFAIYININICMYKDCPIYMAPHFVR